MTKITDEYMRQMRAKTRNYTIVILKAGLKIGTIDSLLEAFEDEAARHPVFQITGVAEFTR